MVNKLTKCLVVFGLCFFLIGAWPNTGKRYPFNAGVQLAYTGPADVVASATSWWGLRAYSKALASAGATTTPVIDVRGSNTATGCTIYLLGNGGGALDLSTAGAGGVGHQCLLGATTFCTVTNTSCTVSKMYDQAGGGNHITQGTAADQPTFTFSGLGSYPILAFNGTTDFLVNTGTSAPSNQPWTMVGVYDNTVAGNTTFLQTGAGSLSLIGPGGANMVGLYSGTAGIPNTATDNTWVALAGVANGASSVMYVDGSGSAPGNSGSRQIFADNVVTLGTWNLNPTGQYFHGNMVEAGIWESGFSSGNASSMSSNQHTYWGF